MTAGHTARTITGVNEMSRLFADGLDRLNSLLSDETVGKAIINYLFQLKGKLGLQIHGQSQALRQAQPITLGLELLLALSTGQLGSIELPNKEPARLAPNEGHIWTPRIIQHLLMCFSLINIF